MNSTLAECALIQSVLYQPALTGELDIVPEMFESPELGELYGRIVADHLAGEEVGVMATAAKYGEKVFDLIRFVLNTCSESLSGGTRENPNEYVEAIKTESSRRQYVSTLEELLHSSGDGDPTDLIYAAYERVGRLMDASKGVDDVPLIERVKERLNRNESDCHRFTPSGFASLDGPLGGGFAKGGTHIIGAGTNIGKSAFAQNIALNAARNGNRVDYYSFEDQDDSTFLRLVSIETGIENSNLQSNILSEQERSLALTAADKIAALPITIQQPNYNDVETLLAKASVHATKNDTGLIIVDYIQKLTTTNKVRLSSRVNEIGHVSGELFRLARRTGAAVIVASQIRRMDEKSDGKMPTLSHLRESGQIEQDAHTVTLLGRDRFDKSGKTMVHVAKNKNGGSVKLDFTFKGECLRFAPAEFYAQIRGGY